MTPQRILKDVKEVIPEDAIIFTDVGWNKNGVPGVRHHRSWHHPPLLRSGYHGLRRFRVLGGKLAAPDKIVLTLTGDGGFGVNPTCMATAVEKGIACTWVVMNNSAFGTIAGLENANYKTKFGTVFHTPDGESYSPCWADVAKAYGVDSIRCSTADEFKPALEKAIEANKAGKPFLVEAPWRTSWCPPPAAGTSTTFTAPTSWSRRASWSRRRTASTSPQPLQVPQRLSLPRTSFLCVFFQRNAAPLGAAFLVFLEKGAENVKN